MIEFLDVDDVPSRVRICVFENAVEGIQMFYSSPGSDDLKAGPVHGQHQGSLEDSVCAEEDLEGKVIEINFYGGSSPYLDGIKLTTSEGGAIEAGVVDESGQEKRTLYFPDQSSTGIYDMEFFGFTSSDVSSVIDSIDVVAYNEDQYKRAKSTVINTPSWKEQA